jgi:lipopolysaccharide export system permease protein
MTILDRLVAFTFLRLFVISILATPPLFILGNLTEKLDDYLDAELTLGEIARGYVFNLPEYFQWSFPMAGLIAAVFTVHAMTTHREIVAAKAGGVSFHRLVLPILVLGTALAGLALATTDLVPLSKRKASAILEQRNFEREWRSDFVYQTEGGLLLAVQRLEMLRPRMSGVGIHHPGRGVDSTAIHAEADRALWLEDEQRWEFENGTLRRIWPDGVQSSSRFQRLRLPALVERPEQLMEEVRDPEELTYEELERQARIVERGGGKSGELRTKKEQKLAIPVATLVIILLGTPLATSAKRGGAAYGIGISLGTTIAYVLLLKVSGAFGAAGVLPPTWAAWLPNGLFATAGVFLLARVRT